VIVIHGKYFRWSCFAHADIPGTDRLGYATREREKNGHLLRWTEVSRYECACLSAVYQHYDERELYDVSSALLICPRDDSYTPVTERAATVLLYTASVQPVIGQLDWLHGFPGLFTDTSVPIRFYFLVLFSHFSVFGSVLSIKLPYVSFWAHLKYRLVSIVSYRSWHGDLSSNGQLAEHLSWNRIQLKP